MAQLTNVSQMLPSSEPGKSVTDITQLDTKISTSIPSEDRVDSIKSNDANSSSETIEANDTGVIDVPSDKLKEESPNEDLDLEDEEDESDDDNEFDDGFEDDSMEFGNFGLDDPGSSTLEVKEDQEAKKQKDFPIQSCSFTVNKEQEKMELFWKLMDMGFSRGKEFSTPNKR